VSVILLIVLMFSYVKAPPRPPVWLRKVCQSYLQEIVSKPNGLLNVLMNIVQGMICDGICEPEIKISM